MIEASCHCGAVRLTVTAPPERLTDCNCSICHRIAGLWAYYAAEQLTVASPPEATESYVHGDRTLAFHHCRTCGCTTHWTGLEDTSRVAVNARMMHPAVIADVPVRRFDGADTWTFLD